MVSADSQAAMEKAAKAVQEFLAKNGHKDTTVYELVRPAVFHETIIRNEKEEIVRVLDQEHHQTHYHTSLQPITDEEELDIVHEARIGPVENRSFDHDNFEDVQRRLDDERAKYFDHTEHVKGEHTSETVQTLAGSSLHHHVREYIQPIVNKRTIAPHIVHSVVLVHEKHHNAAIHHQTSVLAPVTMAEFKRQGGVLTGREERFDFFEGEPRSVGGIVGHKETTSGVAGDRETAGSELQGGHEHQQQPAAHETSSGAGPSPPFPVPQRRTTIPPQTPMATTDVSTSANAAPTQAAAPQAQPPAQAAQQAQSAQSTSGATTIAVPAHTGPQGPGGRWSLMPMQLGKAGDASHPPTRAGQHTLPGMHAIYPPRPSVDQQRAGSASKPDSSQRPQ